MSNIFHWLRLYSNNMLLLLIELQLETSWRWIRPTLRGWNGIKKENRYVFIYYGYENDIDIARFEYDVAN